MVAEQETSTHACSVPIQSGTGRPGGARGTGKGRARKMEATQTLPPTPLLTFKILHILKQDSSSLTQQPNTLGMLNSGNEITRLASC